VYKPCLCALLLTLGFSVGCGGGGGSRTTSPPQFTPASIQGQYEVIVTSSSSPTAVSLIEANFTQTGASVFASKQNVVVIEGTQGSTGIALNSLGGECDNGVVGDDSVQGAFSSQTQASISLTEAGSLGNVTATGNVTFSSDGSTITTGTYTIPAACGFLADSGTITGTQIKPFSGSYAGMLANSSGSTDAVIVSVSQSGLNLNVTGTDNGTAFTLTGGVVGATFDVKGTISGQPVEDVGIYDHTNNTFLVFDTQFNFLGTLKAGTNPQSIVVPSGLFKFAR